ncbi:hypothetical protein Ga0080574_TMP1100 [Salipiger abyssi]|uniref:Uncharacterized protein n=1 Tax=Salipiger abyssi TaxID=1250539 RepID=A0A1P8UPU8_9RHOB|nr:hypothetical protein Ga0080574_TMP1100 [Salipiger abyssi]
MVEQSGKGEKGARHRVRSTLPPGRRKAGSRKARHDTVFSSKTLWTPARRSAIPPAPEGRCPSPVPG